jgi:hypothetical protein
MPQNLPGLLALAPQLNPGLVPAKLVDLKTNLKSLRFGADQPDGGSSNSPYVYTEIPDNSTPTELFILNAAKYSYDFPIRGGALAPINSAKDLLRISKFLGDAPKGPLFLVKQEMLQLSNPIIETGKFSIGGGELGNNRFYNFGLNTLAQVAVNAFGIHFERSGVDPVMDASEKYFSIVKKKETQDNRLVILTNSKIKLNQDVTAEQLRNLGLSTNYDMLFDYWGGPGSAMGILGRTQIARSEYTNFNYDGGANSVSDNFKTEKTQYFSFLNETYNRYSYDRDIPLPNSNGNSNEDHPIGKIGMDFRKVINDEVTRIKQLPESDYEDPKVRWESRIKAGNPGKKRDRRSFVVSDKDTVDKVNALPLTRVKNFKNEDAPDLAKFRFETIDNVNPLNGVVIAFRAFIDNFGDDHSATWDAHKYTGRGENFYTYSGYQRSVSFNFKIAALSRDEMKPLYQKLNYLMANLAPDYNTIFMSGPLMRLTVGDYLVRQPGFINNLNIFVDNNTPWEIAFKDPEMYELPHVLNCYVSFTPIHSFLVRRYEKAPFITPPGAENKFLRDINI